MRYITTLILIFIFAWTATAALHGQEPGGPIIVLAAPDVLPHAAATPAAASVTPEQVQALALKWIAVATAIGTALAGFVAFVLAKVNEIKGQVERQGTRLDQHGERIHGLAVNAPPSGVSTAAKLLVIALLCAGLGGCVNGRYQGPPISFSGSYTSPDGNGTVGATVRLDPSFARGKK